MYSWLRKITLSCFGFRTARIRRQSVSEIPDALSNTSSIPSLEKRRIEAWIDRIIPEANAFVQSCADNRPAMSHLFFRYQPKNREIALWLTAHASCDHYAGTILIDLFRNTEWDTAWPTIVAKLEQVKSDHTHPQYQRISIASFPSRPSPTVDSALSRDIILWSIKPLNKELPLSAFEIEHPTPPSGAKSRHSLRVVK